MNDRNRQAADIAKELLGNGQVGVVVGYCRGLSPASASAAFLRQPEETSTLIVDDTCSQNLTKYLLALEEKAAIFVKGCDSRTLVSLIQDNEVIRDNIIIIGIPCEGMLDADKIEAKLGVPLSEIKSMSRSGQDVVFEVGAKTKDIPFDELKMDRCQACRFPNPVISDRSVSDNVTPHDVVRLAGLDKVDSMSLADKRRFWQETLDKCIMCYACRNACPVCVCQDVCIMQGRVPHWSSERVDDREKLFYQMTRALHVAGRCTGCGECERACPMDIPLNLINQKMVEIMAELFDYEPGLDPQAPLPLSTYRPDDPEAK